ncbi:hypothetical protein B0H13DRAFT_1911328 [Mycena leptocephala]|nr:hypothetical protein B0H13DRAFT_1911328 [Mycena leptocephala]
MTNYGYSAPAASVAGAGVPAAIVQQMRAVNAALAALTTAVDALNLSASTLVTTSMNDMATALDGVSVSADAVQQAHADVHTSFNALLSMAPSVSFVAAVQAAASAPTNAPAQQFIRTGAPWTAGLLYSVIPAAPLNAVPDNGGKWFAITRGKYIGLTQNSAISLNAVTGVSTGLSEKFGSQADALSHFNGARLTGSLAVVL